MVRAWLLAGGLVVGGSSAFAQSTPADLLKRAQADRDYQMARFQADMQATLAEAKRLQATSPIRAANVLKVGLEKLQDPWIAPEVAREWTATLNRQLRAVETGAKAEPAKPIGNPTQRAAETVRAQEIVAERGAVRNALDKIEAFHKAGRADFAQDEAKQLISKYPNNPVSLVLAEQTSMDVRLKEAKTILGQQNEGFLLAMRSIDKSATMPKEDLEFDVKYWKEITKRRQTTTLTAKEQAILRSLDMPVNFNFKDMPFDEAIRTLSNALKQPILLDKTALAAAQIESSTPINATLNSISARTALKKILQDKQMTFIIKDEAIQVVSLDRAKEMMVTKVYYVQDLVQGVGPFGDPRFGPVNNTLQQQENVNRLIEQIRGAIDPTSWKELGGGGTITFHWPSMSLVIRQSAEVHAVLGTKLR